MVFGFTSIFRVQYMMARRNRYFKGAEDGLINFNSYIKNLRILVFQTDRQTDRQTNRQRNYSGEGFRNLSVPTSRLRWPVGFMVEIQIRILLTDKVEVQVRILLTDK
jgi:hypothetical protein